MVTASMLLVYIVPSVFVLSSMIRERTLSLHHFGTLRRLPTRIAQKEWFTVYSYLRTGLESSNGLRATSPVRPWRPIGAGISFLVSSFLLFVPPLPLHLPLSFAQYNWDVYPVIQVALAGATLAASFILAFHRAKGWLLFSNPRAEYPHLEWATLKAAQGKKEGKR